MEKICEECGKKHTTSYKHLCCACYNRKRYRDNEEVRIKKKASCDNWRANNLERFNAICRKAVKKYYKLHGSSEKNHENYLKRKNKLK